MRKLSLLLVSLLVWMALPAWADAVPYAVLEGSTLTFRYGEKPTEGTVYDVPLNGGTVGWSKSAAVTAIVFDESFEQVTGITTIDHWFDTMSNLVTADVTHLKTDNCTSFSYLFNQCQKLETITGLERWNTENVKDMQYLFTYNFALKDLDGIKNWNTSSLTEGLYRTFDFCQSLTKIDLSGWDVSKVKTYQMTFRGCWGVQEFIGLDNWDVSAVTFFDSMFEQTSLESYDFLKNWRPGAVINVGNMFNGCSNMKSIAFLKDWDMSNCKQFPSMFAGCVSVEDWDVLSAWNTTSAVNISGMFKNNTAMQSIDLSWMNTNNVTNTSAMFQGNSAMETVNLTGFNFAKVTNMGSMFNGCNKLREIIGANFNTPKATISAMFQNCHSLTSIDLSGMNGATITGQLVSVFDTDTSLVSLTLPTGLNVSAVTSFGQMFKYCTNLTSDIDLSDWNPAATTNLTNMFYGCEKVKKINLSGWNLAKATTTQQMFGGCFALEDLDISGWQTPVLTSMQSMFLYCTSLPTLDVSSLNTANVNNMTYTFQNCESLTELDLSTFNTEKVTNMSGMFNSCYALEKVNLSSFNTEKVQNFPGMFMNCTSLTELDLSNFSTPVGKSYNDMFNGCENLAMLDLSNMTMNSATRIWSMFQNCAKLRTIFCENDWAEQGTSVFDDTDMFLNCNSIVGGAGTTYNETAITLSMAHPDEADNPGYFSAGTLTGIETIKPVTTSAEQQPCYDLLGRPVGNDYRGIVIKNGKKFIQH